LAAFVILLSLAGARGAAMDDDGPTAKPTVEAELKALAERYGAAAVALQGHLLTHAISAGSQLEASVSIVGNDKRDGLDYLTYALDTGIVYPSAEVSGQQQLGRIWSDVIDPSLHKAALSKLRAQGLLLRARSYRAELVDRSQLVDEREAGRLQSVATTFILPLDAIRGYFDGTVSVDELNTRAVIELDGVATALEIIPPPAPTSAAGAPALGDGTPSP
jgi:hypothetical protein